MSKLLNLLFVVCLVGCASLLFVVCLVGCASAPTVQRDEVPDDIPPFMHAAKVWFDGCGELCEGETPFASAQITSGMKVCVCSAADPNTYLDIEDTPLGTQHEL